MSSRDFTKGPVTVTLTGEQWFALMARIANRPLSADGARVYREASEGLTKQILAASEACLRPAS